LRWNQFFGAATFVVGNLFVEGGELMVAEEEEEGETRVGRLLVGSLSAGVGNRWVVAVEVGILSVEVVGIPLAEVGRVVEIETV
jgi:hypothetical protein